MTNVVDGRFVVVVDMVHPQKKEITMTTEGKMREVFVQMWEESERGWGSRPDGFSLHLNQEDLEKYVKAYWDRMPAVAPDEYSRPDGKPFKALVSEECYQQLVEASPMKFGLRYWNGEKRLFARIS